MAFGNVPALRIRQIVALERFRSAATPATSRRSELVPLEVGASLTGDANFKTGLLTMASLPGFGETDFSVCQAEKSPQQHDFSRSFLKPDPDSFGSRDALQNRGCNFFGKIVHHRDSGKSDFTGAEINDGKFLNGFQMKEFSRKFRRLEEILECQMGFLTIRPLFRP